ncbi:hypothetical protein [Microbacterium profundi]
MASSTTGRRVASITVIAALTVVVVTLSVMALSSARTPQTSASPGPVMTLAPTVTPTPTAVPTPTPTASRSTIDRASERFLSFAGTSGWRATAGSCDGAAPVIQRIDVQGNWVDVVSREFTVRQIASLDAHADGAELVGGVDDACTAASLRTFSAGAEWTSYDGALAQSRYVMFTDPATVHTRNGDIAAPCADPIGLRASGDVAALICDEQAWVQSDATWTALPAVAVKALTIDGADIIIGHVSAECTGLALTRIGSEENTVLGCAENVDANQPLALAINDNGFAVWAGDTIVEVAG